MSKNSIVVLLLTLIFIPVSAAHGQHRKKIPQIGFLSTVAISSVAARTEAFRQGLRELGYAEGKDILITWRDAGGELERLSEIAAELVHNNADVIVTAAPAPTRAAKKATATIPIVMAFDNDPVGNGFVSSLAHPGGNVTGLSTYYPEITGKQLEILKELVPNLSRVTVFGNSAIPGTTQALKETELIAQSLGVQIQSVNISSAANVETAFQSAASGHPGAFLILSNPVATSYRVRIAELTAKNQFPAIYPQSDFVEAGGLIFYGPSIIDLYRRAATYVDKILKGAKPADLPVQQPTKFELVINLKAAKQIDLTLPPSVLARADRIIR